MGAQAIGLLIGAVGGTAFGVFNSSRIPPPYGVAAGGIAPGAALPAGSWWAATRPMSAEIH